MVRTVLLYFISVPFLICQASSEKSFSQMMEAAFQLESTAPDSALLLYKEVIDLARAQDSIYYFAKAQYISALVYMNQGMFDSTKVYLNRAADNALKQKDLVILGGIYNATGNLYNFQGDHEQALKFYYKALDFSVRNQDLFSQARIHANIGGVFNSSGRYKQSLSILFKGEKIAFKAEEPSVLGDIYNNISINYQALDSFDLAVDYAYKAMESYRAAGDKVYEALVLTNASAYLLEKDSMDLISSKKALDKSRVILDSIDAPAIELNYYKHLAYYHLYNKTYDEAEKAAKECINYIKIFHDGKSEGQINQVLYKIYKEQGDNKKALAFYERFVEVQDSFVFNKNKEQLLELEAKYQSTKKDEEIAIQTLKIRKSNYQRNQAYVGGLGLLLLGGFLFYRNRKNRKLTSSRIENLEKQQKLMALDYMVQGQEEERKRIAQDLHDGLGGLLSTARLQLKKVHNEIEKLGELNVLSSAELMIDNACTEVRRIAHDMMPGALMDLGLVEAIEDLAAKVMKEHAIEVIIVDQLEEIVLNDNYKVQMYRIFQELINNTVKHAGAERIDIEFTRKGDLLKMQYRDNGKGFDKTVASIKAGLGLKNIESRVKYLNGSFELDTERGGGTNYLFSFSL